jgi:hypothetical protein
VLDDGECGCPPGTILDDGICFNVTLPEDCPPGSHSDFETGECRPCYRGEYFDDWCPGIGCVDLRFNDTSCGSCGLVCENSTCWDGACVSCPEGQTPDSGSDCQPIQGTPGMTPNTTTVPETTYTTDPPSTSTTGCNADMFEHYCPGVGCTDLRFDNSNCNACGNVCYESECYQGICVSCPHGQTPETGSDCVEVDGILPSSSLTSGSIATPSDSHSALGSSILIFLTTPLPTPTELPTASNTPTGVACPPETPHTCNNACVDLTTDVANCGSCELPCQSGYTCEDSQCVSPLDSLEAEGNGNLIEKGFSGMW